MGKTDSCRGGAEEARTQMRARHASIVLPLLASDADLHCSAANQQA